MDITKSRINNTKEINKYNKSHRYDFEYEIKLILYLNKLKVEIESSEYVQRLMYEEKLFRDKWYEEHNYIYPKAKDGMNCIFFNEIQRKQLEEYENENKKIVDFVTNEVIQHQRNYKKARYECECGSSVLLTKKKQHLLTKKHIQYFQN